MAEDNGARTESAATEPQPRSDEGLTPGGVLRRIDRIDPAGQGAEGRGTHGAWSETRKQEEASALQERLSRARTLDRLHQLLRKRGSDVKLNLSALSPDADEREERIKGLQRAGLEEGEESQLVDQLLQEPSYADVGNDQATANPNDQAGAILEQRDVLALLAQRKDTEDRRRVAEAAGNALRLHARLLQGDVTVLPDLRTALGAIPGYRGPQELRRLESFAPSDPGEARPAPADRNAGRGYEEESAQDDDADGRSASDERARPIDPPAARTNDTSAGTEPADEAATDAIPELPPALSAYIESRRDAGDPLSPTIEAAVRTGDFEPLYADIEAQIADMDRLFNPTQDQQAARARLLRLRDEVPRTPDEILYARQRAAAEGQGLTYEAAFDAAMRDGRYDANPRAWPLQATIVIANVPPGGPLYGMLNEAQRGKVDRIAAQAAEQQPSAPPTPEPPQQPGPEPAIPEPSPVPPIAEVQSPQTPEQTVASRLDQARATIGDARADEIIASREVDEGNEAEAAFLDWYETQEAMNTSPIRAATTVHDIIAEREEQIAERNGQDTTELQDTLAALQQIRGTLPLANAVQYARGKLQSANEILNRHRDNREDQAIITVAEEELARWEAVNNGLDDENTAPLRAELDLEITDLEGESDTTALDALTALRNDIDAATVEKQGGRLRNFLKERAAGAAAALRRLEETIALGWRGKVSENEFLSRVNTRMMMNSSLKNLGIVVGVYAAFQTARMGGAFDGLDDAVTSARGMFGGGSSTPLAEGPHMFSTPDQPPPVDVPPPPIDDQDQFTLSALHGSFRQGGGAAPPLDDLREHVQAGQDAAVHGPVDQSAAPAEGPVGADSGAPAGTEPTGAEAAPPQGDEVQTVTGTEPDQIDANAGVDAPQTTVEVNANPEFQAAFTDFNHEAVKGDSRWKIITDFVEQNQDKISGGNWTNPENGVTKADVLADMWTSFQQRHGMDPNKLQIGETFNFSDWNKLTPAEQNLFNEALNSESAEQYIADTMPKFTELMNTPLEADAAAIEPLGQAGSVEAANEALDAQPHQVTLEINGQTYPPIDIPQGTKVADLPGLVDQYSPALEAQGVPPTLADHIIASTIESGLQQQGIKVDIELPPINPDVVLTELSSVPGLEMFNPAELMNYKITIPEGGTLWQSIEDQLAPIDTFRGWPPDAHPPLRTILTDQIVDQLRAHYEFNPDGFPNPDQLQAGEYTLGQLGLQPELIGEPAFNAVASGSPEQYTQDAMEPYVNAKRTWYT